jgi:hypothetical protein
MHQRNILGGQSAPEYLERPGLRTWNYAVVWSPSKDFITEHACGVG